MRISYPRCRQQSTIKAIQAHAPLWLSFHNVLGDSAFTNFGKPVLSHHATVPGPSRQRLAEDIYLLQLDLLVLRGCGSGIWVVDPTLGSRAARMSAAEALRGLLVEDLRPSDLPTSADASGPSAFPS